MDKNIKLLYCILGSIILALLNNDIFAYSRSAIFNGGTLLGALMYYLSSILSFIGFILLTVFSILLILRNLDLKHK
ncbi:hypothetical protein [Clostridium weizhouense]|uniref:Uncharacterized protein n=1 Tax=Clostridium weizhouense TaxID=2859781 RepID=A0ABS7AMQ9_9CLOT|nr:hypothetical protein [Clostridium weizhouense]MBW6408780.1 hypothetical protein [Clostridium weizhouense]